MVRRIFVLLLVILALPAFAQSASIESTLRRFVRAHGFSALVAEIEREGTLLGLSPLDLVEPLVSPASGLSPAERDALLLVLLREQADVQTKGALAGRLARETHRLTDWTLVAGVTREASRAGVLRAVQIALLADRIVRVLEAPSNARAGYEEAAVALATAVTSGAFGAAGLEGSPAAGEGTAVTAPETVSLAETFQSIARLSRSRAVVAAARAAARHLLRADDLLQIDARTPDG